MTVGVIDVAPTVEESVQDQLNRLIPVTQMTWGVHSLIWHSFLTI